VSCPLFAELLGDAAALGFGAGSIAGQLLALAGHFGGLLFQTLAEVGRVFDLSLVFPASQGERLLVVMLPGLRRVDLRLSCLEILQRLSQLLAILLKAFVLLVEPLALLCDLLQLGLQLAGLAGIEAGQLGPPAFELLPVGRALGPELLGDAAALGFGAGEIGRELLPQRGQLGGLLFQTLAEVGRVFDLSLVFPASQGEGLLLVTELGLGRVDLDAAPFEILLALGQLLLLPFDLIGQCLEVLGGTLLRRFPVSVPGTELFVQLPELLRLPIQLFGAMLDLAAGMGALHAVSVQLFGDLPGMLGQACLGPLEALTLRSQELLHPSTLLVKLLGEVIGPALVRERRRGRVFHGHRPEAKNTGTEPWRTHNRANPYTAAAVLAGGSHGHLPFLYATAMGRSKQMAGRSG